MILIILLVEFVLEYYVSWPQNKSQITASSDKFDIGRRELDVIVVTPDEVTVNNSFSMRLQLVEKDTGLPAHNAGWNVSLCVASVYCVWCDIPRYFTTNL